MMMKRKVFEFVYSGELCCWPRIKASMPPALR